MKLSKKHQVLAVEAFNFYKQFKSEGLPNYAESWLQTAKNFANDSRMLAERGL